MAAASHQFLTRPFNVIAASFASKLPSRLGFVSQLRVTICQAPLQKVASDAIGISRRLNNRYVGIAADVICFLSICLKKGMVSLNRTKLMSVEYLSLLWFSNAVLRKYVHRWSSESGSQQQGRAGRYTPP